MKLCKNKVIKEISSNLVPIYKSMGWFEVTETKKVEMPKKPITKMEEEKKLENVN